MKVSITDITDVLYKKFDLTDFRHPQLKVIEGVLSGQSQLLIMPTGGGKSLCYQLPSQLLEGLTIVISPLIALMKDQVDKAQKIGLEATFINSSLHKNEREIRYKKLRAGKFRLLYVTPERFRKLDFIEALSTQKISLLAVDEAHCISQWGQDFRPEYSRVGEIRRELGNPTVLALTATATPEVQQDISQQLQIEPGEILLEVAGLERDNLKLTIHDLYGVEQKIQQIVALRYRVKGPAIVYFSLISTLQEVRQALEKLGISSYTYHGQLSSKERNWHQRKFLESDDALILATPAFGLGVDKPDIRMVIHAELPNSIESYYQEIGRAGRDGLPSECHLLFDEDDLVTQMDFIKWSTPEPEFVRKVRLLLLNHQKRIMQEGKEFLRGQLLFYNKRDFRLETALNMLERWEVIEVDEKRPNTMHVIDEISDELLDEEKFAARRKNLNVKLHQFFEWIKLTEGCRLNSIYSYFGLEPKGSCGRCDLCLG